MGYKAGLRDTGYNAGLRDTGYKAGLRDMGYTAGLRDTSYKAGYLIRAIKQSSSYVIWSIRQDYVIRL